MQLAGYFEKEWCIMQLTKKIMEDATNLLFLSVASYDIRDGTIPFALLLDSHSLAKRGNYDIHSQDEIISTLSQLRDEICVKFFYTPVNYNTNENDRILYINNPEKKKDCPPSIYNFSASVIDMPLGYKCLNKKDITRVIVDMLRASIEQNVSAINSYDLILKFHERDHDPSRPTLLSPSDRNFINAHYHEECSALAQRSIASRRQGSDPLQLSPANKEYYSDKLWPLGIVMFEIEEKLKKNIEYGILKYAMTVIESSSCVVFHEFQTDSILKPKNYLFFTSFGEEMPRIGFVNGMQTISLESMVRGSRGHNAHVLVNLMRTLGVHMMSNRFDRDKYIAVNWDRIEKGKEHYFEKAPAEAWVQMPYDFNSVTHAPAFYMCGECDPRYQTVTPLRDHLWAKTLLMGRNTELSDSDIRMLDLLYNNQCRARNDLISNDYNVDADNNPTLTKDEE